MLALMLWVDKELWAKDVYMKVCEGLYAYGGGVDVSLRTLRGLRGDVCFGLHWPASCAFIAQLLSYTRLVPRCAQKCTSETHLTGPN